MVESKLELPEPVSRVLTAFVEAAQASLGDLLRSIVLYGSAAEGRLRKTSDVNLIVVLARFDVARLNELREPLRTAHAAISLEAMFLLERELPAAVEAFAVKFADIRRRHHSLFGPDPFGALAPSRRAEIARLKQVLLNGMLRLRQGYLLRSLRDEQAARLVADTAGPLRACAEAMLELRGESVPAPKEALARVAAQLPGPAWDETLASLSTARESGALPPGVGPAVLLRLLELATAMHAAVEALDAERAPV